ncbi:MAG: N-acetylglucosamine-6-phosphate deacetylase, partial [Elusimicrobiaceae bacterium]|nr:N-acetylglucosamine-6-phosphate deacetylase [Elusimicrobiaceae bacterium]
FLLPAFVDLHIHGMAGFGPEQGTPQALLNLSAALAKQGVEAFCPTLYCAKPAHMTQLLTQLIPALGKETGSKIIGFHLEGPFISPQKPGVMRPEDIAPANLNDFIKLYEAAKGHLKIVTLAPELPGIDPVIEFCVRHNILVQAGHTNATYEQMQDCFDKGVRRVTHWANAMSGLHQRAPGVFGAALINPDISCEVIADGKHVHPALLELLHRAKPISHITAVTDALLPTHQTKGPFLANHEEVVLQDCVWKRQSDHTTAGSALTMPQAFTQLLQAGYSPVEAVVCTSTNAARLVRWNITTFEPNSPANLVLLDTHFTLRHVFLRGKQVV